MFLKMCNFAPAEESYFFSLGGTVSHSGSATPAVIFRSIWLIVRSPPRG